MSTDAMALCTLFAFCAPSRQQSEHAQARSIAAEFATRSPCSPSNATLQHTDTGNPHTTPALTCGGAHALMGGEFARKKVNKANAALDGVFGSVT